MLSFAFKFVLCFCAAALIVNCRYLRFFRLCFRLFLGATVIGVGVVLPISYTAQSYDPAVASLDRLSIANVPEKDSVIWVHFLYAYGFSVAACYMIYKLTLEWLLLRAQWLRSQQLHSAGAVLPVPIVLPEGERMSPSSASTQSIGGQMTIFVSGIPKAYRTDDSTT